MRAFIGIDFSSEAKAAISMLQNELRGNTVRGRWKYHDNFHLTLKFFSEINDMQKIEINRVTRQIVENNSPFSLGFSDLGVFKGRDSIRVLWMGLNKQVTTLNELFQQLDNAYSNIGFDKEKRAFQPHVTIGQELVFDCSLEELAKKRERIHFPEIYVDRLHLFKSEQIGNKRVYTKIEEYKLLGDLS